MGAPFPAANDAASDVKMTIAVMRWAYAEAHKRARASSASTSKAAGQV